MLAISACTPRINTADLTPNMTRQEVISRIGQPVGTVMQNGRQEYIFKIHDHAFGRDMNLYRMEFQDDKLVSILPLPSEMQYQGPVDRALAPRTIIVK